MMSIGPLEELTMLKNLVLVGFVFLHFQTAHAELVGDGAARGDLTSDYMTLFCSSEDKIVRAVITKGDAYVSLSMYFDDERAVDYSEETVLISKSSASPKDFSIEFIDLEEAKGIEIKADIVDKKTWIGQWTDYGSPGMQSTTYDIKCVHVDWLEDITNRTHQ